MGDAVRVGGRRMEMLQHLGLVDRVGDAVDGRAVDQRLGEHADDVQADRTARLRATFLRGLVVVDPPVDVDHVLAPRGADEAIAPRKLGEEQAVAGDLVTGGVALDRAVRIDLRQAQARERRRSADQIEHREVAGAFTVVAEHAHAGHQLETHVVDDVLRDLGRPGHPTRVFLRVGARDRQGRNCEDHHAEQGRGDHHLDEGEAPVARFAVDVHGVPHRWMKILVLWKA